MQVNFTILNFEIVKIGSWFLVSSNSIYINNSQNFETISHFVIYFVFTHIFKIDIFCLLNIKLIDQKSQSSFVYFTKDMLACSDGWCIIIIVTILNNDTRSQMCQLCAGIRS